MIDCLFMDYIDVHQCTLSKDSYVAKLQTKRRERRAHLSYQVGKVGMDACRAKTIKAIAVGPTTREVAGGSVGRGTTVTRPMDGRRWWRWR